MSFPNIYAANITRSAATSAETALFGFDARSIRVHNPGLVKLYVRLSDSGDADTGDAGLQAGGTLDLPGISPISGISIWSTSTTTGDADVLAIGG